MSSCPSSPLSEDEKAALRESREEQLREIFEEAIVKDLLTLYTTPHGDPGQNPVGELLESMDIALGVDRKRIFISVLEGIIPILEAFCNARGEDGSVQS